MSNLAEVNAINESYDRQIVRTMVKSGYDLQKIRIQIGNRIVGAFKHKLGQLAGMTEEELDKEKQDLLEKLRASYSRLADSLPKRLNANNFEGDGLITSFAEYFLIGNYNQVLKNEESQFKDLEKVLMDFPIYTEYLKDLRGMGPMMSGVIIGWFNPEIAVYPSQFWAYAGLDVAEDGAGRSKRKEHLVEREYKTREGKIEKKMSITFDPFLKTKLVGVLGSSFMKTTKTLVDGVSVGSLRRLEMAKKLGFNPKSVEKDLLGDAVIEYLRANGHVVTVDRMKFVEDYYNYKNRLKNHPLHKEKTDFHRHNMAMRYMIKRFLVDLHINWRRIEGLPVSKEYAEAKLGIIHGAPK